MAFVWHKVNKSELETMNKIMHLLDAAWYAVARACAWSSQIEYLPAYVNRRDLHESHSLGLIPASYGLTTAPGAARLIVENEQYNELQIMELMTCARNALSFLENTISTLQLSRESLDSDDGDDGDDETRFVIESLEETQNWCKKAVTGTKQALRLLRDSFLGKRAFDRLYTAAKRGEKRLIKERRRLGLECASAIGPIGEELDLVDLNQI